MNKIVKSIVKDRIDIWCSICWERISVQDSYRYTRLFMRVDSFSSFKKNPFPPSN